MSDHAILHIEHLQKSFRSGFLRKRIEAVRDVSFAVRPGEILGLIGPNGAGKTTTIKCVLGLIMPTSGKIRLFGSDLASRNVRRQVGYMPENPYIYQYLKPLEFLDLCGRLTGMDGPSRRKRAIELVERVGLAHATDRYIGKFSKGMMQRIGLAQALIHDPAFIILDEPMSGLDPIGRADVRQLILEQRQANKTLLFTSHILSDVETLCDRVVILNQGSVSLEGELKDLLASEQRHSLEGLFVTSARGPTSVSFG
ncbi:MAG: ABC transporter ATP-binding protein [Myxococcales bacterium]|nr:ABC transporter ATP-binding protein [Myxococcales bacterium]MCB9707537.1 ABC transporter ATP-binding protein [Myxococcales bacterium]